MTLLAQTYNPSKDPTGFLLSEKLDGVRAEWDGKQLKSRTGQVYPAPAWFLKGFPVIPLDGELWMGHGQFDQLSSIARSSQDKGWSAVHYMVFDIPLVQAGPYHQRYAMLQALNLVSPIQVLSQIPCEGPEALEKVMDFVTSNGGEGLMLRHPDATYEPNCRSGNLLKYKRFFDAEAIVVGYKPGEGKHKGTMGALWCLNEAGVKFKVGTGFSDRERDAPPPIGKIITYRYQSINPESGKPRFPAFVRIRENA